MDYKYLRSIFLLRKKQAIKGWVRYHRLVKKYKIQNDGIILMPHLNSRINYVGLLYLKQLISAKNYKRIIILSAISSLKDILCIFNLQSIIVEKCTESEIINLISYYELVDLDSRFYVLSLNKIFGRKVTNNLILHRIADLEEIVSLGIYKLENFTRVAPINYTGTSVEINNFFCSGDIQ